MPCDAKCLTCGSGNATHCLTCGLSTKGIRLFKHTDNYCYETCPTGFFGNSSTHVCDACDGTCDGCSLSATNCINCAANNYRQIGSNACGTCASGLYGDTTTKLCTVCPVGCLTCTSASVCASCKAVAGHNHYLSGSSCVEGCPAATFGTTNGTGFLVCEACAAPCATCTAAGVCLTCSGANLLHYGTTTCSASCPGGEFNGGSGKCLQCPIYCKTCTAYATCTACNSLGGVGYYLSSSACIATCPTGNYPLDSNLTCQPCDPACSTCFGPALTQCSSCKNNGTVDFYLIYGSTTCNETCPSDQFQSSSFVCLLCASSCLTCTTNSSNCLTCGLSPQGVNLFMASAGGKCVMTCLTGEWGNATSHAC